MVVIALAVMGVLAIAILTTSGDEREASLAVQEGTRSFYAADAGLNHVVAQWPDSSYDNRVAAAGSSYTFAWRTLPENGATYRAVLQRLSAGGPISLTVDGRSASARRGLRTVQVALTVSSSFKYAVIGDADLKFSGGGTDSWDSALGVYGGANVATNGDIYSNGTISQLSGSTSINGDAQAGTTIVAGGCAKVHGTICAVGQPLVPLAAESCPSGFSPAVDIPGGAGITYNPATGVLSVSGGKTLTLDYSHTPYRFSNVTFSGSSILTFAGTVQHEDIYVSGTLNLSGGTIANPSGKAPNLSIWGCGADASNWTISGGSGAFFAVHAPNHQVTLSGGGAIYGGLVVRSLVNSGGSQIHYDEALGRTGVLVLMPGSWTEVAH
jgi:hypothetical protein